MTIEIEAEMTPIEIEAEMIMINSIEKQKTTISSQGTGFVINVKITIMQVRKFVIDLVATSRNHMITMPAVTIEVETTTGGVETTTGGVETTTEGMTIIKLQTLM